MNRSVVYLLAALAFVALALGLAGVYVSRGGRASGSSSSVSCTPQPGELCPTEQFVSLYKEFRNLKSELERDSETPAAKEMQRKKFQLQGMGDELQAQINALNRSVPPPGYELRENPDATKIRLVPKAQTPIQPVAAPSATPAPPNTKK